MKRTLERLMSIIHEENEVHVKAFITYVCLHTKLNPTELQQHYKAFTKSTTSTLPATSCVYVFTKGSKKGLQCASKPHGDGSLCRKHSKAAQPDPVITDETFEQDFLTIVDEELADDFGYDESDRDSIMDEQSD